MPFYVHGTGSPTKPAPQYTTPTPFPSVETDPHWASVSFLLNPTGQTGLKPATEQGPLALPLTWVGDAAYTANQSPFPGGGSIALDGSGDWATSAASSAFDFGSNDLTIESWAYIANDSAADADGQRTASMVNTWASSGSLSGWNLAIIGSTATTGTGLAFDTWASGNSTQFRAIVSVPRSQWNHVAVTVSGGSRRLFLNGILLSGSPNIVGSGYTQANSLGNPLRVGATPFPGYPMPLNGYLGPLRITKGVARYTANFTPPAAPFPTGP